MNRTRLVQPLGLVLQTPLVVWVLLGFSFTYLFYFIRPIFLSSERMQFQETVPAAQVIGVDLHSTVAASAKWFATHTSPYINNNQYAYPPLTLLVVAPLTRLSREGVYSLVTLVNVVCLVVVALLIPIGLSRPRPLSALLLLALLSGLFAYGFQFELERGQFNLIALCLTGLAIWIYHTHHRWRYLAYALFCLSIQLKIYPAIFIFLFVSDWHAWAANLKRFVGLGLVNAGALLVFGPQLLREFLSALADHSANPYLWFGNHSIKSFAIWIPQVPGLSWLNPYIGLIQVTGFIIAGSCFVCLLWLAYRRGQPGVNPMLLLACAICALVIPAASHDYTLSYLVAPVALLFAQPDTWAVAPTSTRQAGVFALVVVFSAAYATTLQSYAYKPQTLYNNCPALLVMLLAATAIACLAPPAARLTRPSASSLFTSPSATSPSDFRLLTSDLQLPFPQSGI